MYVYICEGNNMFNSILQSHIDISSTALFKMHTNQRVKSIVVQSLLQLLSAIEVLKLSLRHQQTLVILEGLSPLFFVSRVSSCLLQLLQYDHICLNSTCSRVELVLICMRSQSSSRYFIYACILRHALEYQVMTRWYRSY